MKKICFIIALISLCHYFCQGQLTTKKCDISDIIIWDIALININKDPHIKLLKIEDGSLAGKAVSWISFEYKDGDNWFTPGDNANDFLTHLTYEDGTLESIGMHRRSTHYDNVELFDEYQKSISNMFGQTPKISKANYKDSMVVSATWQLRLGKLKIERIWYKVREDDWTLSIYFFTGK